MLDGFADFLRGFADLVEVIRTAQGNAERAGDFRVGQANGSENVRFATFVGGASGTGREVDFLLLEFINQALSIKPRETNWNEIRKLMLRVAEENRSGYRDFLGVLRGFEVLLDIFFILCYNRGMC